MYVAWLNDGTSGAAPPSNNPAGAASLADHSHDPRAAQPRPLHAGLGFIPESFYQWNGYPLSLVSMMSHPHRQEGTSYYLFRNEAQMLPQL